jgi:hypothetical protein
MANFFFGAASVIAVEFLLFILFCVYGGNVK